MNIKTIRILIVVLVILIAITSVFIFSINKSEVSNNTITTETEFHEEIKFTKYNEVKNNYVSDVQMCNIYLNEYKNELQNNIDRAYNLLDNQYRVLKFKNISDFKTRMQSILDNIYNIKIEKYSVKDRGNYKEYICIDQYGNYYIFMETAILQYTVILDTYTIDLPEYVEKYNNSNNEQKVAFCIDKFMKNINAENYTLAYSMLSSGFKNNYFTTESSFEEYAKQNFLGKEITYDEIKSEADIYIYKVNLSGEERNFNVKLGEGTNFELSFNLD